MYAVIRTGGKQYRVAPGDVVKIEKPAGEGTGSVEFSDVLAFTDGNSPLAVPTGAKVLGTVLNEGRSPKVLVFHYKRKKQYKKLQGHRQDFIEIRINSIEANGFTYDEPQAAK